MLIHAAALLCTFAVTWFLSLFCLLSVGMREDGESTVRLSTKFMIATGIASVALAIFYGLIRCGVFDI
jgi:predicted secreted protein